MVSIKKKQIKLCLACSAGGHLTELLYLKKCYSKYQRFFVTFKREDTAELAKKEKVYFVEDPVRNIKKFFKSFIQTFSILSKEHPNVVISTGAGVGVVTCYIAKLFFGSKIIFLESFCRTDQLSLSGKLIYPIADLFFVQWKKLFKSYPKSIYGGAFV